MSASGPMTENAPTLTSGARRAPAETIAVGWTPAIELYLNVAHSRHELRLGDQLVADARLGGELVDTPHDVELDRLEHQLIAREHRSLESRVIDAREEQQRFGVMALAARDIGEDGRDLRHRFDHEHARHHRVAGKVTLEERLDRKSTRLNSSHS